MVYPQPVDLAFTDQLEQQPVGVLEYCQILDAQPREVVYIEEPPIVDFVGRDAPGSQPIRLCLEQLVQCIKRRIVPRSARETSYCGLNGFADRRLVVAQRSQSPLQSS